MEDEIGSGAKSVESMGDARKSSAGRVSSVVAVAEIVPGELHSVMKSLFKSSVSASKTLGFCFFAGAAVEELASGECTSTSDTLSDAAAF